VLKVKRKNRLSVIAGILLVLPAVVLISLYGEANECDGIEDSFLDVESAWQAGELFVLLRHTEKCEAVENGCPPGDRGLTGEGVYQAKLIGEGLNRLGQGNADVYYSPAARTAMTAKIAMTGTMHPTPLPAAWLVDGCKVELLDKIKARKKSGRNLVLVTHSSCLNALRDESHHQMLDFNAGHEAFFGVGVLFRLQNSGSVEGLGCILPSGWKEAADKVHPV